MVLQTTALQAQFFATTTAKKFTIRDAEWLVQVLFYVLLGFDSLQYSVDCPTTPALPARRVSCDLTLSREVRRPRQF